MLRLWWRWGSLLWHLKTCCLGFFTVPLIKWTFLSLFISFPSESPGWRTCSTWQEIKENFPLVALCRQRTFVLERKGKADSKFFQFCLLGKAYRSCWQKVYSPLQRSQLGDFFTVSQTRNIMQILLNYLVTTEDMLGKYPVTTQHSNYIFRIQVPIILPLNYSVITLQSNYTWVLWVIK